MNKDILYNILKYEQTLNTSDQRIRKDYYKFLNALVQYNNINNTHHVVLNTQYDIFFNELIKDKKIIKSCCRKYVVT